jgi:hypothetical protein
MNRRRSCRTMYRALTVVLVLAFVGLFAKQADTARAAQKEKELPKAEKAPGVARQMSPVGTVLTKQDKGWALPALYDAANPEEILLALPGARGVLDVKEGDVRLALLGGLPELSPTPVLESAVILQQSKDVDLDFRLERGRVQVENRKEQGPVKIRLRVRQTTVDIQLSAAEGKPTGQVPAAAFAVELFSRWPAGAPFSKKPSKDAEPDSDLIFLLLKGRAEVTVKGEQHSLRGPTVYHWSSQRGVVGPLPLKQMPAWAVAGGDQSPKTTALHVAVETLRRRLTDKKLAALTDAVQADDPLLPRLAVLSAGAVDNLGLVLAALNDAKNPDARATAVATLVHYIGRGTEQDIGLYQSLVEKKKYSPGEAEIIMYLLHGFKERDLKQPETYETLIAYLLHDELAVRELAAGHLYRLVPKGKAIDYDPAAGPQARERAHDAWNKLVPLGKLPPR